MNFARVPPCKLATTMPSKKQRAKAAKAKKAAAKAAEPPRQPALEGPRTLRAQVRADERAIRRQTKDVQFVQQIVPGCRVPVAVTASRSSGSSIVACTADGSDSRDTA